MIRRLSNMLPDDRERFLNTYKKVIKQSSGVTILEPGPSYDSNGVRFPIDYLNAIGTLPILFPLEIMAKYADLLTTHLVRSKDNNFTNAILHNSLMPPDPKYITSTLIGNMAYVCMYHHDAGARLAAESILETIFNNEAAGIEAQRGKIIV